MRVNICFSLWNKRKDVFMYVWIYMLSKVFTYCCHKKESIFCSKSVISRDGKHKETSALRSRQEKKLLGTLKCVIAYLHVYFNIHKYLVRKIEKCFSSVLRREKKKAEMHSSLIVRKYIQAGHVFSGKGSYFILKGTVKSLRFILPKKRARVLRNVWHVCLEWNIWSSNFKSQWNCCIWFLVILGTFSPLPLCHLLSLRWGLIMSPP